MIITTWNCNLKLQKKYEYIESLNSDIAIIQECEKLKQDYLSMHNISGPAWMKKKVLV